ncbi:MAG TPA: CorA family divalent cation transporter [Draconibacterium sp.]|nr:CorA family divalent cation transporter [Draconibacterium sp.]
MDKNNSIFLVGGRDLEMVEILKILDERGLRYFDKKLSWGAKLSEYKEYFNNNDAFVGIELIEDITPPANYTNIDHHNVKANLPSSIEQIAQMLDYELDRWQQLIAANDKGFIPAMEAMGATPEEITRIRQLDREAQGVTENDEQLAERSIRENRKIENGITVVRSLTPRFSTITDRLYPCKRLLVYTNDELNYFGEGAKKLIVDFNELIIENYAYSGGMGEGYFGINPEGMAFLGKVETVKDKIINHLTEMKPLYSYHIFIFPFKWDNTAKANKTFSERFDLTKIKAKDGSGWINLPDPISAEYATELYNEKNFFYKFVHPVLYDTGNRTDPVILHYERKEAYDNQPLIYEIDVIANRSNRYRLNLKSIGLNLYSTGTGSLVFYLENNDYPDFEDVLRINQFGRRILPPFLDKTTGVLGTKYLELANHIAISGLDGDESRYFEDFADYTDKTDWKPARFIKSLMDDFDGNLEIKPVTDDRMYVLCRYENDMLGEQVKGKWLEGFKNDWYRFLFIDGGKSPMCQNRKMKDLLIKDHTYTRWTNWRGIHGISRYSFVYLTSKNPDEFLKTHFRTIYTRMVELSLIQRASILKFSEEVTELSKLKNEKSKNLSEVISELYKAYIRFVNQIYFREVTAQEQGIELYNLLQDKMKIAEQVKDLDGEIEELHNYANLLEQKDQERRITIITVLGAIFLPATFLVGLFGINTLPDFDNQPQFLFSGNIYWPFWISVAIIIGVTISVVTWINKRWNLGFRNIFKRNKNK